MSHVTYEWVVSHIHESWHVDATAPVMSHMNESCPMCMSHVTYEWVVSHKNGSWQCGCITSCSCSFLRYQICPKGPGRRKKTILRLLNVDSHCVRVRRRGGTAPSVVYLSASPGHARMCMCVCVWMRKGLDATWGNTCTYVCEREREREREMEQSRKNHDYN